MIYKKVEYFFYTTILYSLKAFAIIIKNQIGLASFIKIIYTFVI